MSKLYHLLLLYTALTLLEACCPEERYCETVQNLNISPYSLATDAIVSAGEAVPRDSFSLELTSEVTGAVCMADLNLGSQLMAMSCDDPTFVLTNPVVSVSITSPFDLSDERTAGTELNDLFTPIVIFLKCGDNGTTTCSRNIYDYEGVDNLTDALNEVVLSGQSYQDVNDPSYQQHLLVLDAESLAKDLTAYQFDMTVLLDDGTSFELSTGEVKIK